MGGAAASRPRTLAALVLAIGALICLARPTSAQPLVVDLGTRIIHPGDAVLVNLTVPAGTTTLAVTAFGTNWPAYRLDERTWRALIGVDLDRKPGTYTVTVVPDGSSVSTMQTMRVVAKTFRRRVLTVNPDFVNPPASQQVRIEREATLTRLVYAHIGPEPRWRTGLLRPVKDPANSSFGTRSVFNGQARSPHAGTDFLSAAGTPIHAPGSGQVVVARDLYFSGNTVIIDHGLGVFSMLAHMSRIDVKEGHTISRGDTVGLVGATGRVTGPHLHWAFRIGAARVDPLSALAVLPVDR